MSADWITVATFDAHGPALLAKSLLDAAGLACWLRDEHLVRMTGRHFGAIEGIKLQVHPADLEAAREILDGQPPAQ